MIPDKFRSSRVIFVGPSRIASASKKDLDEYEYVARINKFLETEAAKTERCDILFINSACVRFYLKKIDNLKNKIIIVKRLQERLELQKVEAKLEVYDLEFLWRKMMLRFQPHQCYYGTLAIEALSRSFLEVKVSGVDFYHNGFETQNAYIEGYYDLDNKKEEERQHSIEKDKLFLEERIKNSNILLDKDVGFYLKNKTQQARSEK